MPNIKCSIWIIFEEYTPQICSEGLRPDPVAIFESMTENLLLFDFWVRLDQSAIIETHICT